MEGAVAPRMASWWPHRCGFGLPEAGGTGAWSALRPGATRLRPWAPEGAGGLRSPALPLRLARPLLVVRRHDAPGAPGRAGGGVSRAWNGAFSARGERPPAHSSAARPRLRPVPPLALGLPASGTQGGGGPGVLVDGGPARWRAWASVRVVLMREGTWRCSESAGFWLSSSLPSLASLVTGSPPAAAGPSLCR